MSEVARPSACLGVQELVPFQRMAELVVAEAERGCGRALIEAVARKCVLQQRSLIVGHRSPEVRDRGGLISGGDQVERRRWRRLGRRGGRYDMRGLLRSPRRVEGIEN